MHNIDKEEELHERIGVGRDCTTPGAAPRPGHHNNRNSRFARGGDLHKAPHAQQPDAFACLWLRDDRLRDATCAQHVAELGVGEHWGGAGGRTGG